jgi:hypothetical protein
LVADVALHEPMIGIIEQGFQRIEVGGIRQLVHIDDATPALGDDLPHETTADEPRASGDQDRMHVAYSGQGVRNYRFETLRQIVRQRVILAMRSNS